VGTWVEEERGHVNQAYRRRGEKMVQSHIVEKLLYEWTSLTEKNRGVREPKTPKRKKGVSDQEKGSWAKKGWRGEESSLRNQSEGCKEGERVDQEHEERGVVKK